jgi:hypothetical protein
VDVIEVRRRQGFELEERVLGDAWVHRYTLRNLASTDAVVFIEVVDTFKYDGKDMTSHWSSVLEVNPSGKITAERDYYDMKEFETQLA